MSEANSRPGDSGAWVAYLGQDGFQSVDHELDHYRQDPLAARPAWHCHCRHGGSAAGGARGWVLWSPWLLEPLGAGLSSLFVRLSPSAGGNGGWQARSLALHPSCGPGARDESALLPPWGSPSGSRLSEGFGENNLPVFDVQVDQQGDMVRVVGFQSKTVLPGGAEAVVKLPGDGSQQGIAQLIMASLSLMLRVISYM